jgi:hypothetical protein
MANLAWALASFQEPGAGEEGGAAAAAVGLVMMLIWLAVVVVMVASMWKVFTKAGEPGWAAIVPIYNLIVLLKISSKPIWWIVLFLIPLVNIVMLVLTNIGLAQNFGKGAGFGLGLAFLSPIFYPMLAFGDATYRPS